MMPEIWWRKATLRTSAGHFRGANIALLAGVQKKTLQGGVEYGNCWEGFLKKVARTGLSGLLPFNIGGIPPPVLEKGRFFIFVDHITIGIYRAERPCLEQAVKFKVPKCVYEGLGSGAFLLPLRRFFHPLNYLLSL
ncbi:MAG: hypothetical protein H6575_11610 [Lewinellaceae bacterium]|nr:hypothetical protein [Lewinellaceae bacterium]